MRVTGKISILPLILLGLTIEGCEDRSEPSASEPVEEAAEETRGEPDAGQDAGHDAGPPREPARIFATRYVSKVREAPDREAFRLGYLRAGAVLMATTAEPVRVNDPRCPGGWYELTTGGFVCNGRDVIAFWGRRLPQARGEQPDTEAPLPYRYARTRRDRVPMYRRLPTDEEAAEYEGYRIPGQAREAAEDGEEGEAQAAAGASEGAAEASDERPSAEGTEAARAEPREGATRAEPAAARASASEGGGEDRDDGDDVPTLESLMGDPNSALLRRLVRGFIVSLDRDFRAGPHRRRYWRTINNGFVPYHSLVPVTGSDFEGTALDDDTATLPIAYVLSSRVQVQTRDDQGRTRRGRAPSYHDRFFVEGEEIIRDTPYWVGRDGVLLRQRDVTAIVARERPDGIGESDKWLDVDLENQTLVAYEGDRPVYATLISSGRVRNPDDPLQNHETPTGTFRVRAKHLASAMDGDHASDGPYSIDDVPYVMYFQLAYAVHSAFWHNGFGRPRSHGCVNLAPRDARFIFGWADPQLPEGWHGVYPTEEQPGTYIHVHGETPRR